MRFSLLDSCSNNVVQFIEKIKFFLKIKSLKKKKKKKKCGSIYWSNKVFLKNKVPQKKKKKKCGSIYWSNKVFLKNKVPQKKKKKNLLNWCDEKNFPPHYHPDCSSELQRALFTTFFGRRTQDQIFFQTLVMAVRSPKELNETEYGEKEWQAFLERL